MPQAKPEQEVSNAIRLAVGSLPDVRLWRNNVGTLLDSRGIPVSYGLANGSADLVGLVAPHGRMLSIEVKRPGFIPPSDKKLTAARAHPRECKCLSCKYNAQLDWRDIVRKFGGVAGIVETVGEAMVLVSTAREAA